MESMLKLGRLKMRTIEGWQNVGLTFQMWNLSDAAAVQGQGSTKLNRLQLLLSAVSRSQKYIL